MAVQLESNVAFERIRESPDPGTEAWIVCHLLEALLFWAADEPRLRYGTVVSPTGRHRSTIATRRHPRPPNGSGSSQAPVLAQHTELPVGCRRLSLRLLRVALGTARYADSHRIMRNELYGRSVKDVSNSRSVPCSHRLRLCTVNSSRPRRNAHSQTIATRQPAFSSCTLVRWSRFILASNLVRQKSGRVVGLVAYGQPV